MLATERPGQMTTAGIPDLIFEREGTVVAAECKRLKGKYRANDCSWRTGGDVFRPNQEKWVADAVAAGLPRDAILEIWWTRIDQSYCD
jgi:hypothetical protein